MGLLGVMSTAGKGPDRDKMLPLSALQPGERGTIVRLPKEAPLVRRLAASGLIPGVEVVVQRRVPAFVVQAGGTRIALDRRTAAGIVVILGGEQ